MKTTETNFVKSIEELKRGMRVKMSDGTKEPPKHHTRKHEDWAHNNREVWIHEICLKHNIVTVSTHHPDVKMSITLVNSSPWSGPRRYEIIN
ncbi:hypothetical protein [Vibrio barjaei]|uniref:hypothetical protein n=1 Tax=Vibrio barjaei TaxID=1676683 RepID=UPI002283487B|nr:hypothetical protein [Vibrio barjaei]MCY9874031.1 hypothetical protein [Vibrio barjaei]